MELKKVLAVQTYSGQEWRMFALIIRELKRLGVHYTTDEVGNIYAQKGSAETFPCVVAHMDSVHKIVEDLSILQVGDNLTGFNRVTMQQTGIGGDDKVGVYIALQMVEKYDNIKAAFFVDEERGCNGSGVADVSFFDDCRFILQADRRGNGDFITEASGVKLSSRKFQKAVRPYLSMYGYKTAGGLMTDVMALKENGVKVSCANVSCGYYRPHSADEYVNIKDVQKCLDLFCAIVDNLTGVYAHSYQAPVYAYSYGGYTAPAKGGAGADKYADYWNSYSPQTAKKWTAPASCDNCLCYTNALTYSRQWGAYLCHTCSVAWD